MTRFLATTALVSALLATPALAQTMNSAPTPAPAPAPMGATSNAPTSAPAQMNDKDQTVSPDAKADMKSGAPQAGNQAPAAASGSSMRPAAKAHHRKPGDDSANRLNQAELQKVRGQ